MTTDRPSWSSRDREIVRFVWLYRYLATRHVSRLVFGHRKLAQRAVRRLVDGGMLDRFRPDEAVRSGFRSWWFRLGPVGARLVAEQEGLTVAEVTPPVRTPRSLAFLRHHGAVTDFRIWLREGLHGSGFECRFVPEFEEVRGERRRRVAFRVVREQTLVPDGAFVLEREGKSALFLLEVDRGTEPLSGRHRSAIHRKLRAYRNAYDSGDAGAHFGELFGWEFRGFRVLCVVPSERRRDAFIRLAEHLDLAPLVWVTTKNVIAEPGRLDRACWLATSEGPLRALVE